MTVMYQTQNKYLCDFYGRYSLAHYFVHVCVFPEINRVRKDMYSDTVNGLVDKHPLELPEPVGPIVHQQEKLFVPVKEYPDVSTPFHTDALIAQCQQRISVFCQTFFYSS